MSQYWNDLTVTVSWLVRQKLNRNWNTDLFSKPQRLIPYSRIYFPVAGSGTVEYQRHVFELSPGKILLVPAFAEVKCRCPDHLEKYWCHFNAFWGKSSPDIFALNRDCIELPVPDMEFVIQLFERLIMLSCQTESVRQFEFNAGMRMLLARFLDKVSWSESEKMIPGFTRLLIYISDHLDRELSLQELSEFAGICPSHLSHQFHEKMGMRLFEYITMHRMYKAMFLLRDKQNSVSEISDQTGFSNISVFSKSFKRHTGYSPLEFRKYFTAMPAKIDIPSSFQDPQAMLRFRELETSLEKKQRNR